MFDFLGIFDFLEIFEILLWDPKIRIEREKLCRFIVLRALPDQSLFLIFFCHIFYVLFICLLFFSFFFILFLLSQNSKVAHGPEIQIFGF